MAEDPKDTSPTDDPKDDPAAKQDPPEDDPKPGDDSTDEPTDDPAAKEPDWKRESRKHENRAKQERKAREKAEAELAEARKGQQSEQEQAIEEAKKTGKTEAEAAYQEQRRRDQLEVQVTRLAAKTFADTEDALLHVERGIAAGDIDADDIFNDEGKVQTAALKGALEDLLERKPHLKAGGPAGAQPTGDADGGKGKNEEKTDDMNDLIRRKVAARSSL